MDASGVKPINMVLKTGTTIKGPGKIIGVYDSTGVDLAINNEIAIGVSAGASSRDADGALDTAAGATVAVYPLGGVLMVQSKAGDSYNPGTLVYVDAAGLATTTSSSRKLLGVYVGPAGVTGADLVVNGAGDSGASEGTMIAVMTAGAATA
tara:strand:+ start:370 stop:822 length:453 start_codon:yes stop_codon:yes gene_type:complete